MDPLPPELIAWLALFVFLGFGTQAMAGFGGTVITLTLGALVAPLERLVPIVVAVGWVQTFWLALRLRRHVRWRLLGTVLLPLMVAGGALGFWLQQHLGGVGLKLIYGGFVVCVATRELVLFWRGTADEQEPLRKPLAALGTLGAGVIHGIYASGGPLLVYVVGRLGFEKASFRATLIAVWLPLNTVLLGLYVHGGRLSGGDAPAVGLLLVPIGLALFAGEWAHHRVDERRFRAVANAILLLAGGVLLATTLTKLARA